MSSISDSSALNNLPADCRDAATLLNRECFCQTVDRAALKRSFEGGEGLSGAELLVFPPNSFSPSRVFVAQTHIDAMARLVRVIEGVVARPAWQERVLAYAPDIARHVPRAAGVFLGYDFHLDPGGPRLIEINTNAGGGLLNARLLDAQIACCPQVQGPRRGAARGRERLCRHVSRRVAARARRRAAGAHRDR